MLLRPPSPARSPAVSDALLHTISKFIFEGKTPPEPLPFDVEAYPWGKRAGDDKAGFIDCPTCGRPPTHPTEVQWPWPSSPVPNEGFHMFRDELSAREYYISGMCQACQDGAFKCEGET